MVKLMFLYPSSSTAPPPLHLHLPQQQQKLLAWGLFWKYIKSSKWKKIFKKMNLAEKPYFKIYTMTFLTLLDK